MFIINQKPLPSNKHLSHKDRKRKAKLVKKKGKKKFVKTITVIIIVCFFCYQWSTIATVTLVKTEVFARAWRKATAVPANQDLLDKNVK